MSAVGFGLFMLAVIAAGCLLSYAWGWQDAKACLTDTAQEPHA